MELPIKFMHLKRNKSDFDWYKNKQSSREKLMFVWHIQSDFCCMTTWLLQVPYNEMWIVHVICCKYTMTECNFLSCEGRKEYYMEKEKI